MNRCKNLNIMLIIWVFIISTLICTSSEAEVIYVDDDASGANDGSSWTDAYNHLQDALAAVSEGDEIRVAHGVYRPDLGGGNTPGDRRATFQLINGVIIKGGYTGLSGTYPNVVDINLYESILSGDLNGDDVEIGLPERVFNIPPRKDNSCHIVTGNNVDETAVLNGFTIIGGLSAFGDCNDTPRGGEAVRIESGRAKILNCLIAANSGSGGGVVLNNDSNSTFVGCVFSRNYGLHGAMQNIASSPTVTNCTFEQNHRGMENRNSSPVLTNCVFQDNNEYGMGNSIGSSPIIINCIFENNGWSGIRSFFSRNLTLSGCLFNGNTGFMGAGIDSSHSDLVLYNCKFIGNRANAHGGGIYSTGDNIKLYNCIFGSNSADMGGAIASHYVRLLTLHNCIINDNSADYGGGGIDISSGKVMLYNCTLSGNTTKRLFGGGIDYSGSKSDFTLTNCIVWGNTPDQIDGEAIVSYSNVQGGLPGEGNIDVDPLFADLANGDYHLKSQAGRWDPVNQTWIQDDVTSPCIDAGDPRSALSEEPQPNGQRINMGAYGGTSEASLSLAAN